MTLVSGLKILDYSWRLARAVGVSLLSKVRGAIRMGRADPSHGTWLIAEREDEARDNGFHLFRYLRAVRPDIPAVYAIRPDSPDSQKVAQLGPTVRFGSLEHHALWRNASVVASTHACGAAPFGKASYLVPPGRSRTSTHVHLKHGISKDHHQPLTSDRYHDLLTCGAQAEAEYLNEHRGPKTSWTAVHTGLARYDALSRHDTRGDHVLYMPTFRKWLHDFGRLPAGRRQHAFEGDEYFKRVHALLASDRLHAVLEERELILVFYPHPRVHPFLASFTRIGHHRVRVLDKGQSDIQHLLRGAKALITDFSSVFFDMAYMNRPTIYYQFDTARYRQSHYREGYFSYERDGFGAIVDTEDGVALTLDGLADRDFVMEPVYAERADSFFGYRDGENCARIVAAVEARLAARAI